MMKTKVYLSVIIVAMMLACCQFSQAAIVGNWQFNDGSGTTAADSSGYENTGYLGGYGWGTAGSPDWSTDTPDSSSHSLYFDGGDTVLVPDSDSLDVSNITIECWVKLASAPDNWDQILDKENAYQLLFDPQDDLRFYVRIGGVDYGVGGVGTSISLNEWHYIAATYDGSTLKLYIDDNTPIATAAASGDIDVSAYRMAIGSYYGGIGNQLDAKIDSLVIHDTALSASELSIPEPATMLILTIGAAMSMRRKRR